jgi:predicted DNA-binding protein (MmcQ/YjbR family)
VTYDEYNDFCRSLPATSYIVQWGKAHIWKVGGEIGAKVFAIGGWEKLDQPAFTFKASTHNFDILQEQPGFRPAPYMASRGMKWIQQYDAPEATDETLRYYLQESHRIVSLGLTKKLQKELGLNQT